MNGLYFKQLEDHSKHRCWHFNYQTLYCDVNQACNHTGSICHSNELFVVCILKNFDAVTEVKAHFYLFKLLVLVLVVSFVK